MLNNGSIFLGNLEDDPSDLIRETLKLARDIADGLEALLKEVENA